LIERRKPVAVRVTPEFLRQLFDELLIFEKVRDGYFGSRLYWQSKSTPRHLPSGSSSQIWEYITLRGTMFARVHQYRDPQNRPLGLPDPKYLLLDEVALFVSASPIIS